MFKTFYNAFSLRLDLYFHVHVSLSLRGNYHQWWVQSEKG